MAIATVPHLDPSTWDITDFNHSSFDATSSYLHVSTPNMQRMAALVTGIAMIAIAFTASSYLLGTGFYFVDFGYKASHSFAAGFTLYTGGVYALGGVGNTFYTAKKVCQGEYTGRETIRQIGNTLLLPFHPRFFWGAIKWALVFTCCMPRERSIAPALTAPR